MILIFNLIKSFLIRKFKKNKKSNDEIDIDDYIAMSEKMLLFEGAESPKYSSMYNCLDNRNIKLATKDDYYVFIIEDYIGLRISVNSYIMHQSKLYKIEFIEICQLHGKGKYYVLIYTHEHLGG